MNNAGPVAHYWSVVAPTGDVVVCQLVRTPRGLEVQCVTRDSERVLRASNVKTLHDGSNMAEAWRAWYAANGWRTQADNS